MTREELEQRQRRLDMLSDWERQLLLAYLDGRSPEYVDEWFLSHPVAAARSADS